MIGQRLGPYRIERELGAGGMGTVYAAVVEGRCPGLATGTQVALKVLHPDRLEAHGFFKRFLREAEIGKAVVHENVARTFDCDEIVDGGVVYAFLVMEYVEGQTLRGLLKELERVPEELCRHVGREVAKGLAAIHAAGAIHRDVKPENILITKDHVVKVMDLGVARRSDDALQLSQTGSFVGSIPYAAPESFGDDAKRVDGRVDLHALGLVLYELASGFNPYLADTVPQVLRRILHEEPRRLGEVNPQLSPFFEEVVHRLLAKDPADRFADAEELLAVLEAGEKSPWWTARATAIRAVTNRPLRRIRIPRDTAVYGRERELETLRALFERAKAGEGQVVLIDGEAGIGKSRVVDEWIGRLQRDGEELHFLFGGYPPGGAATASGAFATAYREHFGGEGLEGVVRERLGVARGLAPAYAALLLGTSAPAWAEPLTKDSLQTCFIHTTRSLAAERTTVVLVDDLHFAPEEGRALFASLALSAPGQRLLLVGTTRPGVDGRWLAQLSRLPHTSRIGLDRLGPKDLVRLLADAFHSEHLASELAGRIALKSDGNPFFVFEILRGLREGQFLAQKPDGTWVTTKIVRDIRIPSSITDLVNARVADLDEESKNLLDVAACCGFTFDAGVVAAALGVSEIHALQALARIERRHRLVRSAGEAFVFDHHQIQEALYGGLPPPLAHAYHAAIGDALEARSGAASKDPTRLDGALCVDIAEHFLKGGQGTRARRYLDAALAHLGKAYLGDREVALATAALAAPGLLEGRARAEAILRLAREAGPLEVRGHAEIRRTLLDEAVAVTDLVGDGALRGQAKMLRGWAHIADSRYAEAEACMREALALARAAGDRRTEAYAHGNLGHIHAHRGAWAEAAAAHARHLAIGVEIGDARLECNARVNVGNALYAEGRLAEAREQHARALARSREAGNRTGEAGATVSLGNVCYAEGRLSEARALYERALEMHRAIGNRQGEANSTSNIGTIRHAEGRLPEALELYGRALFIFREIGNRPAEGNCLGNLGNVLEALDRLPEAREHQEQARAIARELGNRQGEASATVSLGNLADAQGRHAEAQTYYERALEIHRAIGNRQGEVNCLGNLGGVFRSLGRPAQARAHAERALALCREIEHRYGEPYVLLGLCAVEAEDGDDAAALRRAGEALAVSRTLGDGACIADSLVEIADLHRRSGDLDAACAALDEALPLLREQQRSRPLALALAMRACLPQGDAVAAEAALAAVGSDGESARMRWLLWTATGTPAHLAAARCRLDEELAKVPAEHHEPMRMNLRLHREIAQARVPAGR